jgi:hypothetical protein
MYRRTFDELEAADSSQVIVSLFLSWGVFGFSSMGSVCHAQMFDRMEWEAGVTEPGVWGFGCLGGTCSLRVSGASLIYILWRHSDGASMAGWQDGLKWFVDHRPQGFSI